VVTILLAWEEGKTLDGIRSLPHNLAFVENFALSPLVGLNEFQLIELVNDLLTQKISLHNRHVGGGDPHMKTTLEWSIAHKQKKVI
jgi:hypothetical protein